MVSLKKENRRRVQGAAGIGIIDKQGREKGRCEVVVVEMSHHLSSVLRKQDNQVLRHRSRPNFPKPWVG
jgi:hypothetical protein